MHGDKMYYAFIVNPIAGTGFALEAMERIEQKLQAENRAYRVFQTEAPGHGTVIAADLARDPEVTAVISVGGDGTAEEIAAGLKHTQKPMGIIPAGTGNDFIKSAGIPSDPLQALDRIFAGQAKATDTGMVNDRFFLNVCGTGFDVTVLDYAEEEKKKHRGLTPYFLGLLKAIFHYQSVSLSIEADGQCETGTYLIASIANGKYIGGGIPICPDADIQDGKLDLVLIRHVPRWKIPLYLPGLMMSKALKFSITRHMLVNRVVIEGNKMRINIDGSIVSRDSASFMVEPGSLMLIR